MPGNYAHYRFGAELLQHMTPKQQRSIGRFRQLYDMGLHGPDIFYYTDPLCIATDGKLGQQFHSQTGVVFFEHACRAVKLRPSEAVTAYLYGLLAHYALDSISHPFIEKNSGEKLSCTQIETEFDRHLLVTDGKKPAYLYDGSRHIQLTAGECETVAALYPGVSPALVQKCVKNMAKCTRSLVMAKGVGRELRLRFLETVAPRTAHRVMGMHPNREGVALNPSLMRLFEMAQKRFFALEEQLHAHLRKNKPLGTDFAAIFGQ